MILSPLSAHHSSNRLFACSLEKAVYSTYTVTSFFSFMRDCAKTNTGSNHRRVRAVVNPAFSAINVRALLPAFQKIAENVRPCLSISKKVNLYLCPRFPGNGKHPVSLLQESQSMFRLRCIMLHLILSEKVHHIILTRVVFSYRFDHKTQVPWDTASMQ